MSDTIVKAVYPDIKRTRRILTLENSWQSAPVAWNALWHLYGSSEPWLLQPDRLWAIAGRVDVPLLHRTIMLMTYDRAYIADRNFHRAMSDINSCTFLADSHWSTISRLLGSTTVPAIGFHWTTVSPDVWASVDWSTTFEVYDQLEAE